MVSVAGANPPSDIRSARVGLKMRKGFVMGKVEENKLQKLNALLKSSYELFITKGIAQTSIHDIVQKAGVAKGTFYLYFKDKYEIRDRLVVRTAERLFVGAYQELQKESFDERDAAQSFEDKMIFLIDYVLEELKKNKLMLQFLSKNLSRGFFHLALEPHESGSEVKLINYYYKVMEENPEVHLRNPETMLFLIIELAGSASFSTILENDPISFEELKPELYRAIRAIIRSHIEVEEE